MKPTHRLALLVALLAMPVSVAGGAGLRGSPGSMAHQHAVALQEDYTFLRTPLDVQRLAQDGRLVKITDGEHHVLSRVSYPYARPEVRSFIQRLAADFHEATGGRLVVTSLTRPQAQQPRNAHKLSVHPAGMAVDLRVPEEAAQRAWLERALLTMEEAAVLDATRERSPAHYHIAVFGDSYGPYAARLDSIAGAERAAQFVTVPAAVPLAPPSAPPRHDGRTPAVLLGFVVLAGATTPAIRGVQRRRRGRGGPAGRRSFEV